MIGFDYNRARETAKRLIGFFGQTGSIRRNGSDITVVFAETNYSLDDRGTGVIGTEDRRILLEAIEFEPQANEDLLVIDGVAHKIIPPVIKLSPAGVVVYYELQVRR